MKKYIRLKCIFFLERRIECLRWKREALEVESRLADQRRQKIAEALEATRTDEQSEDEKQVNLDYKSSADEKVRSAFKNLISKLKNNPPIFDQVNTGSEVGFSVGKVGMLFLV